MCRSAREGRNQQDVAVRNYEQKQKAVETELRNHPSCERSTFRREIGHFADTSFDVGGLGGRSE